MSDTVQQIKQRLSIVDVVASYIKLQKAGKNYKAKSPFTNEKTPSFFVSPDRDMYYCFSSGKGGDIFTFVQEMEGLDFKGALAVLAERAGVELQPYRRGERDERDRLYQLMEEVTIYYSSELKDHPETVRYLTGRGLTKETIGAWRLGYAKSGWRNLVMEFTKRGYKERELERAGLIKRPDREDGAPNRTKEERYYDRFRKRIMFPIMDSAGRVIAFSGRIFPNADEGVAKYINSPDTPLYSKSHVLYGYHRAKHAIRKFDFSMVVEGQMDLLMSHQAGYTNTTAVSGSAMTDAQLLFLKRLSNNVVLAFDADSAGVASSGRTAGLALESGMDVKVAALPSGVDPADLVLEGDEVWKKVVRASRHIVEFHLDHLTSTVFDTRKLRLEVGRVVLPYVAMISNRIDQAHFVSLIATRLGMGEEPVWEELGKYSVRKARAESERASSLDKAERQNESVGSDSAYSEWNPTERRLIGIILWQRALKARDLDVVGLEKKVRELMGEERISKLLEVGERAKNRLLFEVESVYEDAQVLDADVEELLAHLRRIHLVQNRNEVLSELHRAEEKHDRHKVESLTKKYAELTQALETLTLST